MGEVPLYFTEWIAIVLAVMNTLDFTQVAIPYLSFLSLSFSSLELSDAEVFAP